MLVVATPCPLILATPVAIIGGINRAARHGIIFRHGGALEQLGQVNVAVFDKTGTLTVGHPEVAQVIPAPTVQPRTSCSVWPRESSRARGTRWRGTVVGAARARGLAPPEPRDIVEAPGSGVGGRVDGTGGRGRRLDVPDGALSRDRAGAASARADRTDVRRSAPSWRWTDRPPGSSSTPTGSGRSSRAWSRVCGRLGLRRVVLLSGDDQANTDAVARAIGIEEAHGELLPEDKVAHVRRLVKAGEKVLMVGDGTNDAPALSSATVGIALASGGGGITAEAADAVLLADDPLAGGHGDRHQPAHACVSPGRASGWGSGSARAPWRRRAWATCRPRSAPCSRRRSMWG